MSIYTDGSGIKIGVAAYNTTTDETKYQHLGDDLQYNLYAAELTAIHMDIMQWQENIDIYPKCHIDADNQAAGTSICQSWRQSGQTIIRSIIDLIDDLMAQESWRQLDMIWISGHHGICEGRSGRSRRSDVHRYISWVFPYTYHNNQYQSHHHSIHPCAIHTYPRNRLWARSRKTINQYQSHHHFIHPCAIHIYPRNRITGNEHADKRAKGASCVPSLSGASSRPSLILPLW